MDVTTEDRNPHSVSPLIALLSSVVLLTRYTIKTGQAGQDLAIIYILSLKKQYVKNCSILLNNIYIDTHSLLEIPFRPGAFGWFQNGGFDSQVSVLLSF